MSTSLKLTVAEYDQKIAIGAFDRLDRRVELIHGELREINPAGPLHEDIICFLTRWSTENTSVDDILVRVQMSVGISALDSVPEPDLSWVRSGSYRQRRPEPDDVLLVIEVADSSIEYDLSDKLKLYAAAGIREYWVVNLQQQRIEVLREPAESGYRLTKAFAIGESLSPLAVPKAKLDVAELLSA